jgi:hypothetical protein
MNLFKQHNQRKVFVLAVTSVMASMLFSFLGAPFLRAFAVSARSIVFWTVGVVFIATLFIVGLSDSKVSQAAVYVGATWMTLGSYNELEKRGIHWRLAGSFSLLAGILFAAIGYFYLRSTPANADVLIQIVTPIHEAINKAFPENPIELKALLGYLPGLFIASLFSALVFGFLLESRVVRLFGIQKFKVASGLKWLDFRLPDLFIWVSLFSLLFSVVNFDNKILQTISINVLIFSSVAYLVQGLIVVEFIMRFLRFGTISKTLTYMLVFLQLAPFVVLVGLIDYWADFRKLVRRKAKTNG